MKIGVVGLGLIGGSIFKALENIHKYDVVAVSNSQNGLQENITADWNILKDCNIVFVATPISKTLYTLEKLESMVNKDTVVADVCSIKEFVCQKEYTFNFVPTHPMAGTEEQGYENSFKELFNGTKWVICNANKPLKHSGIADLIYIIENLGAKVVFADPKAHDEAVALISHMPMVIAQALCRSIKGNELAQKLASSGFRDMTRLALSNLDMARDMVNFNSNNIENSILKLYSSVGDLMKNDYFEQIFEIKNNRLKMYKIDGTNNL